MIDRRSFMGLGALAVAAAACRPAVAAITCCAAKKGKVNFKFGMAGFSCHRLSLDETKDMLARAGFALSPSSRFDLIVEFFIDNGVYDLSVINEALYDHGEPLLAQPA